MAKDTKVYQGTGRRKTSVARVRMTSGTGKIQLMDVMFMNISHMKPW